MRKGFQGTVAGALAVFALALAIRSIGIDQDAAGDELYTYFAAKELAASGSPSVHGGEPYTRAVAYTWLIAGVRRLFGDSLVAARIPAALFGSLAAAALFWWLRRGGHSIAAWIAGILLATSPQSLILSQQVRFYTAQGLFFLVGCMLTYFAFEDASTRRRRIALSAGALASIALSVHLQPVSIIGAGGLGLFVLGSLAIRWRRFIPRSSSRRLVVVGLAIAVAGIVYLVLRTDVAEDYARLASHADLWAQNAMHKYRYYFWRLGGDYPFLTMLLPLLVLVAAVTALRLTALCVAVFGTALVVHSALPWKSDRYFDYAMPFFFLLGALGWARAVPLVQGLVSRLERRQARPPSRHAGRLVEAVVFGSLILLCVASGEGLQRTLAMLGRDPRLGHPGMEQGSLSWSGAVPLLAPLVASSDVVVTSEDAKTLYYFGRVDYVINRDHVADTASSRPEFSSYPSFGGPVFYTSEALARVVACHASGLLIVETASWGLKHVVPPPTVAAIEATMQPVPLPEELGLRAYRWKSQTPPPAEGCPPRPEAAR